MCVNLFGSGDSFSSIIGGVSRLFLDGRLGLGTTSASTASAATNSTLAIQEKQTAEQQGCTAHGTDHNTNNDADVWFTLYDEYTTTGTRYRR